MPATLTETEQLVATVQGPAAGDSRTASSVRSMGTPLASRTKWLWKRLQEVVGTFAPLGVDAPVAIESVDTTADTITLSGHGFSNTDAIVFVPATSAVLPSPLVAGTTYYARDVATDTFKVAATSGGAAINLTTAGSGSFYVALRVTPKLYGYAALAAAVNTFTGTTITHTLEADTFQVAGATQLNGPVDIEAALLLNGDLTRLGRNIPREPVTLADADVTIGSSDGDSFVMVPASTARIITLRETTAPVPVLGEEITISKLGGATYGIIVIREGAVSNNIASIPATKRCTLVFHYINLGSGAHWRLKSAFGVDGTDYGVGLDG